MRLWFLHIVTDRGDPDSQDLKSRLVIYEHKANVPSNQMLLFPNSKMLPILPEEEAGETARSPGRPLDSGGAGRGPGLHSGAPHPALRSL